MFLLVVIVGQYGSIIPYPETDKEYLARNDAFLTRILHECERKMQESSEIIR